MKADDFCIYFAESISFSAVNLPYAFSRDLPAFSKADTIGLKKVCQAFFKTICDFEENLLQCSYVVMG